MVSPTFHPSMNIGTNQPGEHHNPEHPSSRCHFTVSAGVVAYCEDCSHPVRGSFPLEAWPREEIELYEARKATGTW